MAQASIAWTTSGGPHVARWANFGAKFLTRALRWLRSYCRKPPAAITFWMYASFVSAEGGAGAEEGREEGAPGVVNCPVQRTVPRIVSRVDRGGGAVSEEQ